MNFKTQIRYFPLQNGNVLFQHAVEDIDYGVGQINPCLIDPALFDLGSDIRTILLANVAEVRDPVTQITWDAEHTIPTIEPGTQTRLHELRDVLNGHIATMDTFEAGLPEGATKNGMIALREVLKSKVTL